MLIKVHTLTGKTITLEGKHLDDIDWVKAEIQKMEDIPAYQQQLIISNIKDDSTGTDYKIPEQTADIWFGRYRPLSLLSVNEKEEEPAGCCFFGSNYIPHEATLHVLLRLKKPVNMTAEKQKQSEVDLRRLRLFQDDLFTDFTIRVNAREIRAHRAVMAASSPVFFAMLQHEESNEAKNRLLIIDDMDHDVVLEMLHWIYAARSSKDISEIACELLIAAEKYGLEELKKLCETSIIDALSIDNVCHLLVVAEMYGANLLKLHALQFILQHPKDIMQKLDWSDILKSHPALVGEIVSTMEKEAAAGADAEDGGH